jgi:hypothetical protein
VGESVGDERAPQERTPRPPPRETPECDICGSEDTQWVKCKLICQRCRTILMSCEDV